MANSFFAVSTRSIVCRPSWPSPIAKYNRAIFAKRILMNSDLPVKTIAFASGFDSIRQFNNVFKDIFKVSPSDIRKKTTDDKTVPRLPVAFNSYEFIIRAILA